MTAVIARVRCAIQSTSLSVASRKGCAGLPAKSPSRAMGVAASAMMEDIISHGMSDATVRRSTDDAAA